MRQDRAQALRCDLVAYDNGRRPAAREILVGVLIVLAAGERHDLGRYVGGQLLLAGAAFDDDIILHLVVLEAQELDGNNVCALMQELIEGVLAVGAGLAEDHGAGHIVNGLAEAVDALAVGFHIQLLQVGREADQGLGIRQDRCDAIAQEVALVNADQRVEQGRVLFDIRVLGQGVFRCRACHDAVKDLRTEGQGQDRAADTGGGRISAADEIIHIEGIQISGVVGQRGGRAGNRQHMFGGIQACLLQSVLDEHFVGQGLQCGAGLGNNDKEGMRQVCGRQDGGRVIGVYVGDELGFHLKGAVHLCPVLQGKIQGAGAKVGSADTDLDCCRIFLAFFIDDLARVDFLREFAGSLLLRQIEISLVLTVDHNVIAQLAAAELMQDSSLLTGIDDLTVVKSRVLVCQLRFIRESLQGIQQCVIDLLGGIAVNKTIGHGNFVLRNTFRAAFAGHSCLDIYGRLGDLLKFLVRLCLIKINPLHL